MRILALETVESTGSVAALQDNKLLAQRQLAGDQRSAQSLAPAIGGLLTEVDWPASEIELLAVAAGPGSFTGLRIGVTTAKTLAYAIGCPIIGVNTLEVIATRVAPPFTAFWTIIDAQRQQLFAAQFVRSGGGPVKFKTDTHVVDTGTWLARLSAGDVVTGPGLRKLADHLPEGVIAVDEPFWSATASSVGQLGHDQFMAGRRDNVFELVPLYFRRTAAEEQWEKRGHKSDA